VTCRGRRAGEDCFAGFPGRCLGLVPPRGPWVKRERSWRERRSGRGRGRTSLTPADGGRRSEARTSQPAVVGCRGGGLGRASRVVRGSSEWSCIHPLGARPAGALFRAYGSRPARSSCATIAAPALVVRQPRGGDRRAPQRVHQVRAEAVALQRPGQPSRAERGPGRRRRPRRQPADHRQDRLHPVRHVAVGQHPATLIDDRHLAALAVHVFPDLPRLSCE
jgi:hypothetical protein